MIRRLYVENYKLFDKKTIDFAKTDLFVFDGPNGYGKTSLFDAIELLVKGRIERIEECKSIDGTLSYNSVFLAKDKDKEVIVKAEFEDSNGKVFAIGTKIKSKDYCRENNPKGMMKAIQFYELPSFDDFSPQCWNHQIKDYESFRREKFGTHTSDLFEVLHYVSQEERLAFFNQTEAKRSEMIEKLFGVEKYVAKIKNANQRINTLNYIRRNAETELHEKFNLDMLEPLTTTPVQYHKLLKVDTPWDRETVHFPSDDFSPTFDRYCSELEKLEKYICFKNYHKLVVAFATYDTISTDKKETAVKAWLLSNKDELWKDKAREMSKKLDFCKKEKNKCETDAFLEIQYEKLFDVLHIEQRSEIITEISQLRQLDETQRGYKTAYGKLVELRSSLHSEYTKSDSAGICPYCGYGWANSQELEKQFDSVSNLFFTNLQSSDLVYYHQKEKVRTICKEMILPRLTSLIEELQNIPMFKVFNEFKSEDELYECIERLNPLLKNVVKSPILLKDESVDNQVKVIIDSCEKIRNSIPEQYYIENSNCKFTHMQTVYALNEVEDKLTTQDVRDKCDYLRDQFRRYLLVKDNERELLSNKVERLKGIISTISEYRDIYVKAIKEMKKEIIDEIGILFYIYSSRLLLSHQGGGGIFIKVNDDIKEDNASENSKDIKSDQLRFTSCGKEHDVLYTMSSGQMSAILLAFSLAMNKIYADEKMNVLFIDDPIQCMDDINMVSFVELLRNAFSTCQIIMSTHEKDFSNYIRYKYEKNGLKTESLSLKDT